MLPPTILTEAIAQVGAIMILAKPENRDRLPFFAGIERVRYRRPVHPGDVVVIEAVVRRLRSRMGMLHGIARVDGQVVVEGTMTFALGPRATDRAIRRSAASSPPRSARRRRSSRARSPRGPPRARDGSSATHPAPPEQDQRGRLGLFHAAPSPPCPRVSRSTGPVRANAAPA